MLTVNPLSKSSKSLKEAVDKNRSSLLGNSITSSIESVDIKLPKIKSQKAESFFSDMQDNYTLRKNKKPSLPSFSKERLEGMDPNDKVTFPQNIN